MKKILFIFALIVLVASANAQRGKVFSIAVDTLNGNETVNFEAIQLTGSYDEVTIQILCTQLGGTSDGTLILYGSLDGTSYQILNATSMPAAVYYGFLNDTLTVINGAIHTWIIEDNPFKYYRYTGVGTASDTTKITGNYQFR